MSMKFSQLQCKEVICLGSGQRLGFISDVLVDIDPDACRSPRHRDGIPYLRR